MSQAPGSLPADPFGRVDASDFSVEGRLHMLDLVADALVAGDIPPRAAALWLGAALQRWRREHHDLERVLGVRRQGKRRSITVDTSLSTSGEVEAAAFEASDAGTEATDSMP